jgi:hypothetical protein
MAPVASDDGEPLTWDIGTALSVGWDRVKLWWPVLIFGPVVVGMINNGVSLVHQQLVANLHGSLALLVDLSFTGVTLVVTAFFTVGLMRAFLTAARGQEPQFGMIFSGADRMWLLLGTQILTGLAVMAGCIALLVPGIILALGLAQAQWICVDEGLPPTDAMKRSWAMMHGSKAKLFGFGFVAIFVCIAGLLALVVGVVVAIAVLYAGTAWIYLRLRGEAVPEHVGQA